MRRTFLLPALLLTMTAATLSQASPAHSAADCNQTQNSIAATQSGVSTIWEADCNTKWQATIVLQYRDSAGLWHTSTCQNSNPCRHDKPSDGTWFAAWSIHRSTDDWNPVTPADICSHAFRLRGNYSFYSGAGGVTWNGTVDNDPCHV